MTPFRARGFGDTYGDRIDHRDSLPASADRWLEDCLHLGINAVERQRVPWILPSLKRSYLLVTAFNIRLDITSIRARQAANRTSKERRFFADPLELADETVTGPQRARDRAAEARWNCSTLGADCVGGLGM